MVNKILLCCRVSQNCDDDVDRGRNTKEKMVWTKNEEVNVLFCPVEIDGHLIRAKWR